MKAQHSQNELENGVMNVYRTEKFIVYQSVHLSYGPSGNMLVSDDIFRKRTPARDKSYEKVFGSDTPFTKRRRMRVAAYTRKYAE